jgi:hypothetical protein
MSHIIVRAPAGVSSVPLIRDLLECVNGGVSHIAITLRNGAPLFDGDLFARPAEETFGRVRQVLAALQNAQIEAMVFEGGRRVSSEFVENLISSWNESVAQFDKLSQSGHEA